MIKWGRRGHDVLLAALFLALSPTLSGCSGDDEAEDAPAARIPIHFSANIGGGEDDDATSRATMDGTGRAWAGGEIIRVGLGGDTFAYTVSTSDKKSLTQTTAGAANCFYWQPVPTSYELYARSYGNTTDPAIDTSYPLFTLATNQNTTNKELLFAHQTIIYGGTPSSKTTVTMYHQLAKVNVVIKYAEAYSSSTTFSKVKSITYGTSASKLPLAGTFTSPALESTTHLGTWVQSTTNTGVITPKTTVSTAGAEQYSAVLIPGSYAGKQLFAITLDDGRSTTFAYTAPSGTTFDPGKAYTYTITVDDVKIRIGSITVTGWTTGTGHTITL